MDRLITKEATGRNGRAASLEAVHTSGRAARFVITTPEVDADGDRVLSDGCDLGRYRRNPVVLYGHNQDAFPIGVSRAPDGKLAVWPSETAVKAAVYFDSTEDARAIAGLVHRGVLAGASVAFLPLEAYPRTDVEKGLWDPKAEPFGGRPMGAPLGWLFVKWALNEWSIVNCPSNASALREVFDLERKHYSPVVRKALAADMAYARGRSYAGYLPAGAARSVSPDLEREILGMVRAGYHALLRS
jgi:hypothetical protein